MEGMAMRTTASVLLGAIAFHSIALSAPTAGTELVPTEQPQVGVRQQPQMATYGLCDGPQPADDFPSNPVPVSENRCELFQEFKATSPNANYGSSCGGFTVSFGPMGDLRHNWTRYSLKAGWGDAPLTAANCATARLAAIAWGYRCDNADCSVGAWERIGTPRSRAGTWNATSQICSLEVAFAAADKVYNTLSIDVIATQAQGQSTVRKRAKGSIVASRGNGKCYSSSVQPK
jgi:hypothetical protein